MNANSSQPNPFEPASAAGVTRSTVTRRTAIAGAAWAVPAISLLAATPAAAASADPPVVAVTPTTPTLPGTRRCSTIPAGTLRFSVTIDGVPAKDGEVVRVVVPDGLELVGLPDPHAIDLAVVGGVVTVPAVRAVGSLGSYSVVATYVTPRATGTGAATVPVTEIAAGPLFTWSQVNSSAPAITQNAAWPASRSVAVADNAFVAVDAATGQVAYWGQAFVVNNPTTFVMPAVTGITKVATWATLSGTTWWSGILMTDGVAAWYASKSGSGPFSAPTRLTGFTGAVLDIRVHDSAVYLLTADGVFYGGGAMNGSSATALNKVPNSAGATRFDTWCSHTDKFYTGGAYLMPSGQVFQFTANATTALSVKELTGAPANITGLFAGDNAVAVLTSDGRVFVQGNAFRASAWEQKFTGVAGFSGWSTASGNIQYAGMTMLTRTGGVVQTLSSSVGTQRTLTVGGLAGKTIVDLCASDGFYQALDSTGTVWIWTGNADGVVSQALPLAGQPGSTASLEAFGVHTSSFYGYGIGIIASACPV